MGNLYLGVCDYTDDLAFMCSAGFKEILNICEDYAHDFNRNCKEK